MELRWYTQGWSDAVCQCRDETVEICLRRDYASYPKDTGTPGCETVGEIVHYRGDGAIVEG